MLAGRLRGLTGYRVRPLRRVSVRGYEDLQPWLVERRPPGEDDNALEEMLDELADDVLAAEPEDDADVLAEHVEGDAGGGNGEDG